MYCFIKSQYFVYVVLFVIIWLHIDYVKLSLISVIRCYRVANRWLNFRTQMAGAIVSGTVAYIIVKTGSSLSSTVAGLTLVYAMNFTDAITYISRTHGECQMRMNSVERIVEYFHIEQEKYDPNEIIITDNNNNTTTASSATTTKTVNNDTSMLLLPSMIKKVVHSSSTSKTNNNSYYKLSSNESTNNMTDDDDDNNSMSIHDIEEATTTTTNTKTTNNLHATIGSIQFDNIVMKYRSTEPAVLKGVSFYIAPGTKVGVVGRSGMYTCLCLFNYL